MSETIKPKYAPVFLLIRPILLYLWQMPCESKICEEKI